MNKSISSILIAALLAGSALADSGTELNRAVESEELNPPAIVKPVSPLRNPRFQTPELEAAFNGQTLGAGTKGESVKRIQQVLIDMGFGIPAGATGHYGPQTQRAVAAFQSSRGIATHGKVDKATLVSLDKVSPAPGLQIWQDETSSRLGTPEAPRFGEKVARAVVDLSEHRLFIYTEHGTVEKVIPVASGAYGTPTDTGIKVVYDKVADPTPLAWALWPESRGGAFGTRMLDLSWHDPASGHTWGSGEEMHGTYARDSIGSYASHGCVRLQNEDVEWVYQNLKVGDIIVIRA